jgi:MFS family permease
MDLAPAGGRFARLPAPIADERVRMTEVTPLMPPLAATARRADSDSIESRRSWLMAWLTVAILSLTYGAPLVVVVGLKPIAAALGVDRAVPALAVSLVWVGMGMGGILSGVLADRIGLMPVVIAGAVLTALGLALSATGKVWALYLGHWLMLGVFGNGAVYAPLVIFINRWFDRHRGAAQALIQSGQYVAYIVWPYVFERGIAAFGWRGTMLAFAALSVAVVVPLALLLQAPPQPRPQRRAGPAGGGRSAPVLGLPANAVQAMLCLAGVLCCIPMALPATHLVAHCMDLGIPAATGAAMLSVLMAAAFVSRQLWGWLADRIGGLRAVLAGSACQAAAIAGFLVTQSETGLFTVAALYGLGFSGLVPAYVQAIGELFPASQLSWRVPVFLLTGMSGMALGGWLGGALYDRFGSYAPAFAAGVGFNLLNLLVIGFLVLQLGRQSQEAVDRGGA